MSRCNECPTGGQLAVLLVHVLVFEVTIYRIQVAIGPVVAFLTKRVVNLDSLLLHEGDNTDPVLPHVDGKHDLVKLEDVLTRNTLAPACDISIPIPSPHAGIHDLACEQLSLVEELRNEERREDMAT